MITTPSNLRHVGQHGEIPYMLLHKERLGIPEKGVFVEVGGYDGVTASHSLYFEESGWQGIVCEPDPRRKEQLLKNRKCKLCFDAIGDKEQQTTLYMRTGQMTSTERSTKYPVGSTTVNMKRLDTLMEENGFDHIDFLLVDTEGNELQVVESLGKYRNTLKVIILEAQHGVEKKYDEKMLEWGYRLETRFNINSMYVPKDTPVGKLDFLPIVFPLHPSGGATGTNEEFRYALRSWDRHMKGNIRIAVACANKPDWLTDDVIFIPAVKVMPDGTQKAKGLKSTVKTVSGFFHDGFVWAYDDVVLLKDEDVDSIKIPYASNEFFPPNTKWRRHCFEIKNRLVKEGRQAINFSESHSFYYFDMSMVYESFVDYPFMSSRFPFESWILNKRNSPYRLGGWYRLRRPVTQIIIPENAGMFNWGAKVWNEALQKWLSQTFPNKSRWEK